MRAVNAPTLALTVRQPWAWAMLVDEVPLHPLSLTDWTRLGVSPKRVENRPRRPPAKLLGQRFAIHVGLTPDLDAVADLRRDGILVPDGLPTGCVLGVATLDRWVADPLPKWTAGERYWWRGPIGWLLTDVVALARPVPCRGQVQYGREMPEDVAAQVAQQLPKESGRT